jgi:prohibitin 2
MVQKNIGYEKESDPIDKIIFVGKWLFIIVVGIILLSGMFYTIHAGQLGILLTWGKPQLDEKEPGLHLKIPLVQKIEKMDIQTLKYEADAQSASKDLQIVHTKVAVNYHLDKSRVVNIYQDIGRSYESKVINPYVQEVVKANTAKYTAEELITHREIVKAAIDEALKAKLIEKGIVVETNSITNFDFSEEFNKAIESKVTAEQLVLKAQRDLERIQVEALQAKAKAEGERDAKIANADGDAKVIEIVNKQLEVSPKYIEFLKVQKWNGVQPMYIGGQATPLIAMN